MTCASLHWVSRHGPETSVIRKVRNDSAEADYISLVQIQYQASSSFIQYGNIEAAPKSRQVKPSSAGSFSKKQVGLCWQRCSFVTQDFEAQTALLVMSLAALRTCGKEQQFRHNAFPYLLFSLLTLEIIVVCKINYFANQQFSGQIWPSPDVAYEMISSVLSLITSCSLAAREETQQHRRQHGRGEDFGSVGLGIKESRHSVLSCTCPPRR